MKDIYESFVNLNYKPDKDDLIACYRIEPMRGSTMKRAAGAVAAESSDGTWTKVYGLDYSHVRKLNATVFDIDGPFIKIAYPIENFELGNMPQIYSALAGNILGMKAVDNIRLWDIRWPKKLLNSFLGPQYGVSGLRKLFKIKDRPFLSCVPKPKVGLTSKEHADIAFQVWTGGIDFVKDDENLTNQSFNKFEDRTKLCMNQRRKAEKLTGERKACFLNITAPGKEMRKRLKFIADSGNEYAMIDILTVGWSALQEIRELAGDYKIALYAHRAFHSAFTRNPKHGVSMLTIAETARIIGVDNIHVGTGIGKLVGSKKEVFTIHKSIESNHGHFDDNKFEWSKLLQERVGSSFSSSSKDMHLLSEDWGKIKPVMSSSSGGLHPGLVPDVMEIFGNDVAIQVGGGIHGHPRGSFAGAIAVRHAVDATLDGISLEEKAKTSNQLKEALDFWGYMKPK